MKTKIGEKSKKEKISGVGGWLKAYPGAALLLAVALVGGAGYAVANMPEAEEVPEDVPVVEQPQEENKQPEVAEVVAKTTDEATEEIIAAGAESVAFTAEEEGMLIDIVLAADASEEDVNAVDAEVKEIITDAAFVKTNLFENEEEKCQKAYSINYMLGEAEGEEEAKAAYISSAVYYASEGRNGWLYTCSKAWSGPEAVVVEEETEDVPVASTTPSTTTPSTTTPSTTTPSTTTPNNTTSNQQTTTTPSTQTQTQTQTQTTPNTTVQNVSGSNSAKAKQLKTNTNSDVIGWLQIPNTNINYPVTHTNNNSYYMNYNIYKQWDKNGALLADYECNFNTGLPTNTIIYGHNWTNCWAPLRVGNKSANDVMFAQLHSYADAGFASSTPYIYFSTTQRDYKYQVFAVFYTHQNWTDYIYAYPNAQKMSNIISTAKSKSLHNFGVNVSTNDKIISLSTCTRMMGNTAEYRFVVMGKLVG